MQAEIPVGVADRNDAETGILNPTVTAGVALALTELARPEAAAVELQRVKRERRA